MTLRIVSLCTHPEIIHCFQILQHFLKRQTEGKHPPAPADPVRDERGHRRRARGVRENEQVRKIFWTLLVATAGLMLAQVVDPATAQKIVGFITGLVS